MKNEYQSKEILDPSSEKWISNEGATKTLTCLQKINPIYRDGLKRNSIPWSRACFFNRPLALVCDNRCMRYETVQKLKDEEFKRSTGVQRSTFDTMLEVIEKGMRDFGRPPKLSRADQLLMTLMYWREYRTEFHISLDYDVSEATVCRTIKKVEDVLIKSKQFHLPGKKVLQPSDTVIEVVLVDVTEQPIERPKKDNAGITAAKRSVTPKKRS